MIIKRLDCASAPARPPTGRSGAAASAAENVPDEVEDSNDHLKSKRSAEVQLRVHAMSIEN